MKEYYNKIIRAIDKAKAFFDTSFTKAQINKATRDLDKELQKAEEEFIKSIIQKQKDIAQAKGLSLSDVQVTEMIFAELKNSKIVYNSVQVKEILESVRKRVVKDTNAQMKGSIIAQEEGILENKKKIRRDLKIINSSIIDKTKSEACIKSFRNNKNVEWVEFVNQEDDKVDSVCKRYALESVAMKYSPEDFPEAMVPQTHYNCRCKLKPHYKPKGNK